MNNFNKVLIVDDCHATVMRLAKELRSAGYVALTAHSGVEALEILKHNQLDYVITDWKMPEMNGELLCKCIRSLELNHYVYVILMTAHSELLDLVDGLGAGADDYITKPVNLRELMARLKSGSRILALDRRLCYAADHDPLTGVLNRRQLVPTVSRIMDICVRKKQPVSCIMLDLDHFKQINEVHGHFIGDHVLVQVAEVLSDRFRNVDFICRYGGEEFVVILPECDEQGAALCADRCRASIENLDCGKGDSAIRVTSSFGVSQLRENDSALSMVENADTALRAAKTNGRNRVVKFSNIENVRPPVINLPLTDVANGPSANSNS